VDKILKFSGALTESLNYIMIYMQPLIMLK